MTGWGQLSILSRKVGLVHTEVGEASLGWGLRTLGKGHGNILLLPGCVARGVASFTGEDYIGLD